MLPLKAISNYSFSDSASGAGAGLPFFAGAAGVWGSVKQPNSGVFVGTSASSAIAISFRVSGCQEEIVDQSPLAVWNMTSAVTVSAPTSAAIVPRSLKATILL